MRGADAEEEIGGRHSPEPTGEIADDADADHHDRRGQDSRNDQETDRIDRLGLEGFDFLGDHHGSQFGGDAGAGEAGEDDRGDQRPQLAADGDGDDVGDPVGRRRIDAGSAAICRARIAPMQNRTRQTMGMLRTPTRFICAQRLAQPSRRPCLWKRERRTPAPASPIRYVSSPMNRKNPVTVS